MAKSLKEQMMAMSPRQRMEILANLDEETIKQMARGEWWFCARPEQVPPPGDWTVHLYLGGRGTGKTHSGSEWLVSRALKYPYTAAGNPAERMVMAYNLEDTRKVCIEGDSGILRIFKRLGMEPDKDYSYVRSPKPSIVIKATGSKIRFTGAAPDAARGPNLSDIWMDEIVKWDDPSRVWTEGIYPALRADVPGDKPRAFVTTTPQPIPLLQEWVEREDGFVSMSRGSTFDNALNLSSDYLAEMRREYEGTLIGRQEIYGEMLDKMDGPLFRWMDINEQRVDKVPDDIEARCVGVDPCLTGAENADLMGCVVVSRDVRKHLYVEEDASIKLTGEAAARHIWHVFARVNADVVVVEDNLGKAWLRKVLEDVYDQMVKEGIFPAYTTAPLKLVHSNQGKKLRAEPVANRYQQKRAHHVGSNEKFKLLEKEQIGWNPISSKDSPDRLDALVHACRHLMNEEGHTVRIFSPRNIPLRGL